MVGRLAPKPAKAVAEGYSAAFPRHPGHRISEVMMNEFIKYFLLTGLPLVLAPELAWAHPFHWSSESIGFGSG